MGAPANKKIIDEKTVASYWKANISLMLKLLAVWALVSYGFGILLRPWLDNFSIGGAPLGFWFAQQGSIYVFLILVVIYIRRMNRIERDHGVSDSGEN
jgi:putative solute:sodium symporter small subunit